MKYPAAVLMAAVLVAVGCNKPTGAEPAARNPAPVPDHMVILDPQSPKLARIRVQPVELRPAAVDEIIAPGKVELNPNRVSRLTAPVPGRVARVFVRLGDAVAQGQPLVVIDSTEAAAAIAAWRQAQTQSRVAASALSKAQADLARLRELHDNRAAAWKDVLAAQNEVAQAQAAVEQSETAREEARHRLELLGIDPSSPSPQVTVRAPISGKVLEISVVPGEYRTDTNSPLMLIADLSTVWIASEVPESLIRLITLGERVQIELAAYPGRVFTGRVRRIADTLDPQTRTVKVQAELDNPDGRLRPEMFGRIRHSHGSALVPLAPAAAILESSGAPAVFLERGPGRFELVPVKTGEARNGMVPVLSGLKAGDRIVVDGAILLRNP